jgi:excisionase family DNA binding protein
MSDGPVGRGIAETCAVLGIGRTSLYELIRAGKLPARKIGRRTIILSADLRRYAESLPTVNSKP